MHGEPKITKSAFNGNVSEFNLKLKNGGKCDIDDQLLCTRQMKKDFLINR